MSRIARKPIAPIKPGASSSPAKEMRSAFLGVERLGSTGQTAAQLGARLGDKAALVERVDFITNGDRNVVILESSEENKASVYAALATIGVKPAESFVRGMPGRMFFGSGVNRTEVQVAVDGGDPLSVLANG